MNVKIIITTKVEGEIGDHRSKIWEGEIDILDKREYLTMISIIAEGQEHPVCQVPFALGMGYYQWISPTNTEITEDEKEFPESRDF